MEKYPQLNFSNWYSYLKNITELGVLHVTKVELGGKVFRLDGEDIKLKMEPNKGAQSQATNLLFTQAQCLYRTEKSKDCHHEW